MPRSSGSLGVLIRSPAARASAGSGIGAVVGTLAGICAVLVPGLMRIFESSIWGKAPVALSVVTTLLGAVVGVLMGALLGMAFRDTDRLTR